MWPSHCVCLVRFHHTKSNVRASSETSSLYDLSVILCIRLLLVSLNMWVVFHPDTTTPLLWSVGELRTDSCDIYSQFQCQWTWSKMWHTPHPVYKKTLWWLHPESVFGTDIDWMEYDKSRPSSSSRGFNWAPIEMFCFKNPFEGRMETQSQEQNGRNQ